MYKSVRIQNFRGFEDLTVDGLTRVNLVVGHNGVGKTALLEGLYLLTGLRLHDPLAAIGAGRGFDMAPGTFRPDESLLESLFYQFSMDNELQIVGDGELFRVDPGREEGETDIVLTWSLGDERRAEVTYRGDGLLGSVRSGATPRRSPVFLGTRTTPKAGHEAEEFSLLVQEGKRQHVINSLRIIDPRLKGLELLKLGSDIAVHADVGLPKMVPLGLLGEGLQRLCSLVLATSEASDYVLLVDEIDTGLHYSVLTDMWRVVGAAAREFDYQLFATTHSYECMTAAYEAFADRPEDFSMHRLERVNGDIVCKSFGHETLGHALEHRMEVR